LSKLSGTVIGAIAVLAALSCAADSAGTTDAGLRARRGSFQGRLILTGELRAGESERIVVPRTTQMEMPIRWIETEGTEVKAGQRVVELDNSQFTGNLSEKRLAETAALNQLLQKQSDVGIAIEDAEFAFEQARIALEKAELQAAIPAELLSRRDYEERQLARTKAGVALDKAAETLRTTREASEAELAELQIALDKTRAEVHDAEEAIAALDLRAPRDGILVIGENRQEGRKYQVGDTVRVGWMVAELPELTSMGVEAKLSDVDDGKIYPGLRADCTLDAYPERRFPGRVAAITPVATEQGWQSMRRAFRVEVELEQVDPAVMRPGMSVKVEVLSPPIEEALLVPRAAIEFSSPDARALLADGGEAALRLGPCNALDCVVEQGLTEGARLRRRR